MNGIQTFYSFAATLIPGLLVGGAFAERRPRGNGEGSGPGNAEATEQRKRGLFSVHPREPLALAIFVAIVVAIGGETFALDGAITGELGAVGRDVVVIVVMFGMTSSALVAFRPWHRFLNLSNKVSVVMSSLVMTGIAVVLLLTAFDLSRDKERRERLEVVERRIADYRRDVLSRTLVANRLAAEGARTHGVTQFRDRKEAAQARHEAGFYQEDLDREEGLTE